MNQDGEHGHAGDGADSALHRDWLTIWQSELAAAAVDREAQEAWRRLLAFWMGLPGIVLPGAGRADGPAGGAGTGPAAGAPAAPAAPDPRDAAIERLDGRVAELERRLAALERPRRRGGKSTG